MGQTTLPGSDGTSGVESIGGWESPADALLQITELESEFMLEAEKLRQQLSEHRAQAEYAGRALMQVEGGLIALNELKGRLTRATI